MSMLSFEEKFPVNKCMIMITLRCKKFQKLDQAAGPLPKTKQ